MKNKKAPRGRAKGPKVMESDLGLAQVITWEIPRAAAALEEARALGIAAAEAKAPRRPEGEAWRDLVRDCPVKVVEAIADAWQYGYAMHEALGPVPALPGTLLAISPGRAVVVLPIELP
jgi:hypothetical protein